MLNTAALELNTIELATANPAAAVVPASATAVTAPTAMRVIPVAIPRMEISRVMPAVLTHLSKRAGRFFVAFGPPISSTR